MAVSDPIKNDYLVDGEKHTDDAEGHVGYALQEIDENSSDEELLRYIIDPQEEKLLVRRLDWILGPLVCILYLIAFLDRAQLGNAASAGESRRAARQTELPASLFFLPRTSTTC